MLLVTGSDGFIGKHILHELKRRNIEHIKTSRYGGDGYIKLDVMSKSDWDALPYVDCVIHLASYVPRGIEDIDRCTENVFSTGYLIDYCNKSGARLVFSSSISVYGMSYYGISKSLGEFLVNKNMENFVILRYSSVYGPGQSVSVLPKFIKQAKNGKDITVYGEGKRIQDFVFVKDVVNVNILMYQNDLVGTYNIGGQQVTMKELAEITNSFFKNKSNIRFIEGDEGQDSVFDITKAFDYFPLDIKSALSVYGEIL